MAASRRGEAPLDYTREWVSFIDPANEAVEFRCDITWLTSRWTCVFGTTCRGIVPGHASDGCCTHGAYYTEDADEQRTVDAAALLLDHEWQFKSEGLDGGISETDDEGDRKTRLVDGACIFLNRPGFPGGIGCALHAMAGRLGKTLPEVKPDVCWQLPIKRSYQETERPDGSTVLVTTIAEFDRRSWGGGGLDFPWWCTSSPVAHVGAKPLYESYKPELVELMGPKAYARLAKYCAERISGRMPATHPADPK